MNKYIEYYPSIEDTEEGEELAPEHETADKNVIVVDPDKVVVHSMIGLYKLDKGQPEDKFIGRL